MRRDDEGKEQDVAGELQHCVAQRLLIEHDLDEIGTPMPYPDNPDRLLGRRQERLEGVTDQRQPAHLAQIDGLATSAGMSAAARRRRVPPPRIAIALRADAFEKPAPQAPPAGFRSGAASSTSAATCAAASRSFSQLRRKFATEGTVDQHLGHHDEQHRQDEKAGRKPERRSPDGTVRLSLAARGLGHAGSLSRTVARRRWRAAATGSWRKASGTRPRRASSPRTTSDRGTRARRGPGP